MTINFTDIEKHISPARLSSYRSLNPSGTTEETIGLYYWNKAVSAAFFPAIQCLEVSLRNAIHIAATAHFSNTTWYDPLVTGIANELYSKGKLGFNYILNKREKSESEKKLAEAKTKLRKSRKTETPSGIIAELSFGFWVTLLNAQCEDFHKHTKLWPDLTSTVFPNSPSERSFLFHKYRNINDIRNRLSHHEPIWKSGSATNLHSAIAYAAAQYDEVMTCIGYISADRRDYLSQSYIGKEFKRLLSLNAITEFVGRPSAKATCSHNFKKDLKLHLKTCDKGGVAYISRGKDVYKVVKM